MSSIAVAGIYDGMFTEDMFDEGQELPDPYHRTKFESEKLVRERVKVPWRVYRPSLVVGNSQTGEMDKIDGPYYFFKAIQKLRHALPQWFPLISLECRPDEHRARRLRRRRDRPHRPPGRARRPGVPPRRPQAASASGDVLNTFADAAHAPHAVMRIDKRMTDMLPEGRARLRDEAPGAARRSARSFLADLGIPDEVARLHRAAPPLRRARHRSARSRARASSSRRSRPTRTSCGTTGSATLDPDLYKDRSFEGAVNGKTVVITGASSGIGRAAALKIAAAGGIPILVARTQEKLDEVKAEIEAAGGTAYVYSVRPLRLRRDRRSWSRSCFADHPAIDMLVNNAGRSIRRSVRALLRPLPRLRAHGPAQLPQPGQADARPAAAHERAAAPATSSTSPRSACRRTRRASRPTSAPRRALDAFTRVVSSETIGDNVTFTTIHMPLVRTPMIAPTKIYDSFPTISPDEAADLICEAIRAKPKQINTRLGTFGEVAYALAPKAVDQILHMAYKVFPESAAAKGEKDAGREGLGRGDRARLPDERRALVTHGYPCSPDRSIPWMSPPAVARVTCRRPSGWSAARVCPRVHVLREDRVVALREPAEQIVRDAGIVGAVLAVAAVRGSEASGARKRQCDPRASSRPIRCPTARASASAPKSSPCSSYA